MVGRAIRDNLLCQTGQAAQEQSSVLHDPRLAIGAQRGRHMAKRRIKKRPKQKNARYSPQQITEARNALKKVERRIACARRRRNDRGF